MTLILLALLIALLAIVLGVTIKGIFFLILIVAAIVLIFALVGRGRGL